jgi:hypothetical protein
MRRQTRSFSVEIKRKRSNQQRARAIWGDVDLSTAMAETQRQFDNAERADSQLIDSNDRLIDPESRQEVQAEPLMEDPQEAESVDSGTQPAAGTEAPEPKKRRPRKARTASPPPARKTGADAPSRIDGAAGKFGRKIYSERERAQKLAQIEKSVGEGETLKSAVKQARISEQTYYVWKKAAGQAPQSESDGLKDLVALEEENRRLKQLLAEQLRKENAELKKRLGLK